MNLNFSHFEVNDAFLASSFSESIDELTERKEQ
jgi:hypothetical protein